MQMKARVLISILALLIVTRCFSQEINFTVLSQDAGCNGSNNGSASVVVSPTDPPYTYSWSNGASTSDITGLTFGYYTVLITDSSGDDTTATIAIHRLPCVISPAVGFSPNGDLYNDTWNISNFVYYPEMLVLVYNRWGQKVFESKGEYKEWDGRDMSGVPVPENTYFYVIQGLPSDDGSIVKGTVTILR
jgi:gliding motility-associated-like protein